MVNHIHTLATKEDLDALLKSGNLDAVNKIRLGHGIRVGRTRKKDDNDLYSFATKYCHFSNPKCYPIYDKYVEKAIMELQKSNYIQFPKQYDLHVPQEFKSIINQIIQRFSSTDCQQADRALWIYGQYLAGKWPIPGVPKNYAAR